MEPLLKSPRLYRDLRARDLAQISTSHAEIDLNDTTRGLINETCAMSRDFDRYTDR